MAGQQLLRLGWIRLAPSLLNSCTLRLAPGLYIMQRVLLALAAWLQVIPYFGCTYPMVPLLGYRRLPSPPSPHFRTANRRYNHHEELRCLALRTDRHEVLVGTTQVWIV